MSIDIDPRLWGREAWHFLQNVAKAYPVHPTSMDKNNYKIMFESLKNVLPCSMCRNNYKKHLKEFPINNYLDSRKSLLTWVRIVKSKSSTRTVTIQTKSIQHNERMQRIQNKRLKRASGNCRTCGKL